jgi:hypothetical protein
MVFKMCYRQTLYFQSREQEAIDIQPSGICRSARFSVSEPLQAKAFDNGASNKSLLIVAQCFKHNNDQSKTNR